MGLGASQVRLLSLIKRKGDISRTLSTLSADKMDMTREATKLSQEYTEALNSKTLRLSYNNGVTYIDLSYSNLMTPTAGSKSPTFITDSNAHIIIADNYKKYAEMISPDGSINENGYTGDTRKQILKNLAGVSDEQIDLYDNGGTSETVTLTAEQKSLIAFYDEIFSAIAYNGWIYNQQITDNDYLNETLQNGYYYLTTFSKETTEDGVLDFVPDTDLAVNNENIFQVNNSTKNEAALAKYEAKKAKLNEKESRIDERMQKLETEQSAIKTMMESIENEKEQNIEHTMEFNA